ncbi:response regulator protein [Streptococcus equi subsp. zooepidemicus Sz35]|uniref:LytR/AlgR family response regulator transcription factor n=1 Tax=Streptococcus equi TaxID=1336 RepID=UPI0005B92A91|nr:response regulator transcription factor [Streptococcus equi]MCD3403022.1 response regulator transcription factor [Streptococcus equi subsp. zooepidemicus]KIS18630.1 response regulator protein [Streptococcus equi subsp. zooepidemicus Sz35]HEL0021771.1 response regulator transcription factor [Streptococcus equi subsp. zooepidemicus]HEL0039535.1 response regulator transcription factor [Streptococcus equi subsp. zooepidemicus]HEL0041573.1 response regulator transcription factor [Streptococcus e
MRVVILEDDMIQQRCLEKLIKELEVKHQLLFQGLDCFGRPHQLLSAIKKNCGQQLFFLDIEIKNEDKKGLEVARQIRQINPDAMIVFVTTHSEFMPLAFQYQVSALDYIDKELPHTEFVQRVETALLYAVRQNSETIAESAFYFTSRYAQVQVPFNDILYIETSSRAHRVNLYTKKERMQFTGTLTDILKQESRFLQCHRSFLINPRNVVRVDKIERVVYFRNGSSCLIARSKMNSVLTTIENLHRGDN